MAAIATVKNASPENLVIERISFGISINDAMMVIITKAMRYFGSFSCSRSEIFSPLLMRNLMNINPGVSIATLAIFIAIAAFPASSEMAYPAPATLPTLCKLAPMKNPIFSFNQFMSIRAIGMASIPMVPNRFTTAMAMATSSFS